MVTSTPPKNADDVYEWLLRFINFERELLRRNFTLDAMNVLAEKAGHPEKCAPSLHVAGSKGKGSVTGMIAAILEASGVRTACYSSPHVSDFRERLSMGNGFFSEEAYALAGKELMALVEESFFEDRKEPSFFELLTFWFFLCARHARCGAMAVETGMGGRLDATNILDPLASVITLIELEHTEYLGATIEAIAGEKAGIIKPEKPLILAEQLPEALDVFIQHAVRRNSPLFYFPDCVELRNISVDRNGTSFDLILKNLQAACEKKGNKTLPGLFVPVPGEIQAKNAALAILALKVAFPDIKEQSVYKGLSAFTLPARFERAAKRPPVIIDGAHTKQSVAACLKTFISLYGSGGILIFGCAAGKDVLSMAELCVSCFSIIIVTTPGTFKKSFPEEIYTNFIKQKQKTENGPEILFIPDTAEAIDRATGLALKQELPILGTGSFYLAGEIRKKLKS